MKKINKMTPEEKMTVQEARDDWNNQCKRFMLYKTPFKDQTMKKCLERHQKIDKRFS